MEKQTFYSNGKLLLTGEYVVLDGAVSLAIPTKFGQSLIVEPLNEPKIKWKSLDEHGDIWYEDTFSIKDLKSERQNHPHEISQRMIQILGATQQLNPEFLETGEGYRIITQLNFPRNWGLGTSSTLINNIASWAKIDAYQLLEKTFGGSGYDIACAQNNRPISYQLLSNEPFVNQVEFHPNFKDHIFFVYLNKKQNSREGIAHYKSNNSRITEEIDAINEITKRMIHCENLFEFQILIDKHEEIISNILSQKSIKEALFKNFIGSIKSLGAWGGDFVMVASQKNPSDYFKSKGFETILPYDELIK